MLTWKAEISQGFIHWQRTAGNQGLLSVPGMNPLTDYQTSCPPNHIHTNKTKKIEQVILINVTITMKENRVCDFKREQKRYLGVL